MNLERFLLVLILGITFSFNNYSQTTLITYQGSLNVNNQPATGAYDFEFRLYPTQFSTTQIGSTVSVNAVSVTNGQFVVELSFGEAYASDRFLDIQVRLTGTQTFTPLTPRQRVTSAPRAVNALSSINADLAELAVLAGNANNLGGVAANQYLTTSTANTNYIRNSATQQASTNFNISGTGTAAILNAVSQFNLNGSKLISIPSDGTANLFVGVQAGQSHSTANNNTYVGRDAGKNTNQSENSMFGAFAGGLGASSFGNSFFGAYAGQSNTGSWNTFIGRHAGYENDTGNGNTAVGYNAGNENIGGSENTFLGSNAGSSSASLVRATAVGAGSTATSSNTVMLGTTAETVIAPNRLTVGIASQPRGDLNLYASSGNADLYFQGAGTSTGINLAASADVNPNFFISHYNGTTYTDRLIITSAGTVRIPTLGSAGATALCRNASNDISTCSSSAKYKSNVNSYRPALNIVERLRPVTFNWKDGNALDLGLVAEEVAGIDPLLVTYNDKGDVEGVKYDRIGVVLINVVKEQEKLIEKQQRDLEEQSTKIDRMRKALCRLTGDADFCDSK